MFRNAATDLVAYIAENGFTTMALSKANEALQNAYNLGTTAQPVDDATILNPGITEVVDEVEAGTQTTGTASTVAPVTKGRKKA